MPNTEQKKGLFRFYPHNLLWLGLAILAIVLDQWTKWIASTYLNYADPVPVLPFLNWTLLHNYGAAFSFLSDAGGWQRYFFTSLAGIVSLVFAFWLLRMPKKLVILPMAIALILGGAIGNLIDRLLHGHVIDMLDFHFRWLQPVFHGGHFPTFNLADMAITLGACGIIIDEIRRVRRSRA